jgi:hypothetical protein
MVQFKIEKVDDVCQGAKMLGCQPKSKFLLSSNKYGTEWIRINEYEMI